MGFSTAVWSIRNLNSIEKREVFTCDTVLVLMYTCQIAFILQLVTSTCFKMHDKLFYNLKVFLFVNYFTLKEFAMSVCSIWLFLCAATCKALYFCNLLDNKLEI